MPININAAPGNPHATKDQRQFDGDITSHGRAMDAASSTEDEQYQHVLRSIQLYEKIKTPLDADQRLAMGLRVKAKADEQWTDNVAKTAAILTGIADSRGLSLTDLTAAIEAATLPAEFQAARAAVANA